MYEYFTVIIYWWLRYWVPFKNYFWFKSKYDDEKKQIIDYKSSFLTYLYDVNLKIKKIKK